METNVTYQLHFATLAEYIILFRLAISAIEKYYLMGLFINRPYLAKYKFIIF